MDWSNMIREQTMKFIESYKIDRKIEESVKEVVSSSVKHAMRAPLRARFKDLPTSDMKEIRSNSCWREATTRDKWLEHRVGIMKHYSSFHRDEKRTLMMIRLRRKLRRKVSKTLQSLPLGRHLHHHLLLHHRQAHQELLAQPEPLILPKLLLPPPHSTSHAQGDQSTGTAAPSSSKSAASAAYSAWTTTDTPIKPSITQIPDDLYMDEETTADVQALSSDDEVGRDHVPTVNLRQS
ncbi:hypothetical protein Tco_1113428 [Tanacetum coccineum]|uniref:Uncharacterized protein n=1 Tax=Tanacetum coccineum TaxID=301880 RepID=A0ABQ5IS86_9ASTR